MNKKIIVVAALLSLMFSSCASGNPQYLSNNAIPEILKKEFQELESKLSSEEITDFKNETDFVKIYDPSNKVGRLISKKWRDPESSLVQYFNSMGIEIYSDMSSIILFSFHRYLNGRDIRLHDLVECHKRYWEEIQEQKDAGAEIIHSDYSCLFQFVK
jgi:hypothetical protein